MSEPKDQPQLEQDLSGAERDAVEHQNVELTDDDIFLRLGQAIAECEAQWSIPQIPTSLRESNISSESRPQADALVGASGRLQDFDGGFVTIPSESSSEGQEEVQPFRHPECAVKTC